VSITTPAGFVAAGVATGLKASGDGDLALVATADGRPTATAATFTSNRAAAAPVQVSRDHLAATAGRAAAVVVNSGNANAATGARGRAHAERMCELTAAGLGVGAGEVLVCSTGLIGIALPMERIEAGIPELVASRSADAASATAAARAILTTDSGPKQVVVGTGDYTVAGMAKGAAMLSPDMATMLAFLTTDAEVDPAPLADVLRIAVRDSFNELTVDGCTSTNDTVVLMASGLAGPTDPNLLTQLVTEACTDLAAQMAADAEGGSKVVRVRVTGARSDAEAHRAARKVADSLLVKCSLNGEDPYWGRVVSDLGSAGVDFDVDRVAVDYGGTTVCDGGVATDHDGAALARHLAGPEIELHCRLGLGDGDATVLGVDLGHGYIDENRTTS
jgi:glutamate N-acetyltransferase / amino-acid N-acetyltransferase